MMRPLRREPVDEVWSSPLCQSRAAVLPLERLARAADRPRTGGNVPEAAESLDTTDLRWRRRKTRTATYAEKSGEGRTEVGCGGDGHAAFGVGRHGGDGGEVAVPWKGTRSRTLPVGNPGQRQRACGCRPLGWDTSAGSSEMEPGKTL